MERARDWGDRLGEWQVCYWWNMLDTWLANGLIVTCWLRDYLNNPLMYGGRMESLVIVHCILKTKVVLSLRHNARIFKWAHSFVPATEPFNKRICQARKTVVTTCPLVCAGLKGQQYNILKHFQAKKKKKKTRLISLPSTTGTIVLWLNAECLLINS